MTGAASAAGPGRGDAAGPAPKPTGIDGATATIGRGAARGLAGSLFVTRVIGGVAVGLPVPRARFCGVIASFAEPQAEVGLSLGRADGGPEIPLGAVADLEAIAEWRRLGRELGLPLVLRRADGTEVAIETRLGGVAIGATSPRRRGAALARRRPRFLMRRKTTRLPLRPVQVDGVELSRAR